MTLRAGACFCSGDMEREAMLLAVAVVGLTQLGCAVGAGASRFDTAGLESSEGSKSQNDDSSSPTGSTATSSQPGESSSTQEPGEDDSDVSASDSQDSGQTSPNKPAGVKAIHQVQGSQLQSPMLGERVVIQAVVTADFRAADELRGFFLQEPDAMVDADPRTSEGMLVYCGDCSSSLKVRDLVRVTGTVQEYYGMTQLNASKDAGGSIEVLESSRPLPTPSEIKLPVASNAKNFADLERDVGAYFEAREGMRVSVSNPMTVADLGALAQHGAVSLLAGPRLRYPTDQGLPSAERLLEFRGELLRRRLLWDDTNNRRFASTEGLQDQPVFTSLRGGFSRNNFLRSGDTVEGLEGVLHWSYAGERGTDAWRIRTVGSAEPVIRQSNPRPKASASPDQGKLRVVAIGPEAYFPTVDPGKPVCGPQARSACLGADSQLELERQQQKLVTAICSSDADILAFTGLENRRVSSLDTLLDATNKVCPGYKAVQPPVSGVSSRTCGFMYRAGRIGLRNEVEILQESDFLDPKQTGEARNDPSVAQTFTRVLTGESLTLVVGRFAPRDVPCGSEDDDLTLGQGHCNETRRRAAERHVKWISGLQSSKHVLVMGRLDAFRFEDPMLPYTQAGYVDLVTKHQPGGAYNTVLDGNIGVLDHALSNASLASRVSRVTVWHINADESSLLDYNDARQDSGEQNQERKSSALPLYDGNEFRSGQRDPVLVEIDM